MNYNLVNFCEFDKYAVKSYCAIHDVDEKLNLGDITQVDIDSLPTNIDLITHGSPCFTADTLILTNKGYKPIVKVEVGDMVLDHKLGYSMVTNFFEQGEKEIWEIEADFIKQTIRTTSNHRFYIKTSENENPKWIECDKLKLTHKLALVDNGVIKWIPINSITNTHKFEEVYDIEVENTHSFTANGVIAHNCQSFSVAGKQHGGEKGSGTRSSLLWNSVEIIRHCKPKFIIWENVKNVLSKKHKPVFDAYVDEMKNMGYNTYYQVLNAKNYGIPQNRERIYAISVREDIDNNQNYTGHITHNKYYDRNDISLFPEPFDNGLRLRDFLEDEVDDRYYLHNTGKFFISNSFAQEAKGNGFRFEPHIQNNADIAKTLTTRAGARMDDNFVMNINSSKSKFRFDSTNNELKQAGDLNHYKNDQMNRVYSNNGLSPTITTKTGGGREVKILADKSTELLPRIRKLTPKECYRLMGFGDEDFEKAEGVNSNTQLYRQAGNSIVVNVLEEIYKCLHTAYPNDFTTGMNVISLFSGIGAFEKALERVDFEK